MKEPAPIRNLCVFCGSSSGVRDNYALTAARLGRHLAQQGITLIYGGARVGLMGVLANAVLETGGQVIGVIPKDLVRKEIAHTGLTRLHVVESMHERKARMADLADAFMLLPGGFGSWEEFWEVVTWSQLGYHTKPCGVLNIAGYYTGLLSFASQAVAEGFVRPAHRDMILADEEPERLLAALNVATPVAETKWISTSSLR